jgi:hypothetical protein
VGDVTIVPVDAAFISTERQNQIDKFNEALKR